MACLVCQLFRLKIGKNVDPTLIDDVIVPLLLTQSSQPKQLLQDIKLTRGPSDYVDNTGRHTGESLIMLEQEYGFEDDDYPRPSPENIGHFTKRPRIPYIDVDPGKWTFAITIREALYANMEPRDWGTIDIVNKLRSLKNPHHDSHYPCRWIHLRSRDGSDDEDSNLIESFICNALQEGKRLSWTIGEDSIYSAPLTLVG